MPNLRWCVGLCFGAQLACGGDDGGGTGTPGTTTSSTTTDAESTTTSTTGEDTTTTAPAETTTSEESSGAVDSSTGAACPLDAECIDDSMCGGGTCIDCACFGGNQCDPVVPGGWNACVGENGMTDNTLCMWVGSGSSVGMVSCLNASSMKGANVCFIRGCEEACDCFAPPETGTAAVVCAPILANEELGCALDCSDGKLCPDGMICSDNICFWPPA